MSRDNRKDGQSGRKDASERQREYYRFLTGTDLPPVSTRISAAAAIQKALKAFMMVEKIRNLRRSESQVKQRTASTRKRRQEINGRRRLSASATPPTLYAAADVFEVISGRLHAVETGAFRSELMRDITILIDMAGGLSFVGARKDLVHIKWGATNDVDEELLAGMIRLCATSMHGREQRILLAGARDAIAVISAGVLREYLGCDAATAINIAKGCGLSIVNSDLIDTVHKYRPS